MDEQRDDAPVVVVGAGISGVACARALATAGVPVRLLDRGRRVGGRMAARTFDGRRVDLGASYLTASDDAFAAVVADWQERGLARPWTETFTVLSPDEPAQDKSGPLRWGASPSLRALVEDLAAGLDVVPATVERVARDDDGWSVDGLPARAVVLAMPDPQAARLLGGGTGGTTGGTGDDPAAHLTREWEPVLALAARWERRTWDAVSPSGVFHGAFVNDDPVLAFVADDGRRRGDDAPVLVAHATPDFSSRHLRDPDDARGPMVTALRERLGLPAPTEAFVQRWTFARPTGERAQEHLLLDGLGVCGDGWGPASKVETAWLSGHGLGRRLARDLEPHGGPAGR